eukprot:scaffold467_cov403-Prasinococcus_capsulatus_cf.AAC.3
MVHHACAFEGSSIQDRTTYHTCSLGVSAAYPLGFSMAYELDDTTLECDSNRYDHHAHVFGDPHFACPNNSSGFDFDGNQKVEKVRRRQGPAVQGGHPLI